MTKNKSSKVTKDKILLFLSRLQDEKEFYKFLPVNEGVSDYGRKIKLGFSIYALKIFFMTGDWDKLSSENKTEWINFINNHQKSISGYPDHSFIDENYLAYFRENKYKYFMKDTAKYLLNKNFEKNFELNNKFLLNSIRAESKQCIATLYQVGFKNKYIYYDFPRSDISTFLDSFDWTKPWSAGAQFSGLTVFSKTQVVSKKEYESLKDQLFTYITKKVNKDGAYYIGNQPSKAQTVNGAMKVITGLDWIDEEIHYPERLIDLCLNIDPSQEGCDLVDIVYVLYKCSNQTNYKKKEIIIYLKNIELIINKHFFHEIGGFSYYLNKSQTSYYGVEVTRGLNTPDIHGTILLTWLIAMIFDINNPSQDKWKIIKP